MLRVSNSRPTPCKGAALPTELSIRTSPSPRSEKREVTNCTGNFGCVGAWAKKKFCSLRPCAQNLSCLQVPHLGRRRIFRRLHAYDSSRGELDHYRPLRVAALTALFSSDILTAAVLQNNNLRDIPTDRRAGIRTFASVLGNRPAFLFNLAAFLQTVNCRASRFRPSPLQSRRRHASGGEPPSCARSQRSRHLGREDGQTAASLFGTARRRDDDERRHDGILIKQPIPE